MGFGGGGSGALQNHDHSGLPLMGGPLDFVNTTIASLTANSMTYSDGAALQELPIGSDAQVLAVSGGSPSWITNTSAPLVKVTKTFSDIAASEMDIYTLPQDSALINVWADITTVFDLSTGVTIGDAGDDNGFVEASNWTASTGLTNATRGAYITSFKTMRSVSGTTAIKAYNFSSAGGSLSNGIPSTTNMSNSQNIVRCYKFDVSSLPSPFTVSALGYTGNAGIAGGGGSIVMGLYSDNAGVPLTLLCQTASTTPATGVQTIATTTTPAVTHSGTVWVAMFASGTVDYPLGETGHVGFCNIQTAVMTYPTMPATFSLTAANAELMTLSITSALTPDTQGEVDFYLQVVD